MEDAAGRESPNAPEAFPTGSVDARTSESGLDEGLGKRAGDSAGGAPADGDNAEDDDNEDAEGEDVGVARAIRDDDDGEEEEEEAGDMRDGEEAADESGEVCMILSDKEDEEEEEDNVALLRRGLRSFVVCLLSLVSRSHCPELSLRLTARAVPRSLFSFSFREPAREGGRRVSDEKEAKDMDEEEEEPRERRGKEEEDEAENAEGE